MHCTLLNIVYTVHCLLLSLPKHYIPVSCLCTRDENRTSERNVCTPHISRFLSFRSVAMAIQIPGWCLSPCLCWLRWSFLLTIMDSILKRVGAFTSSSLMQEPHWNLGRLSTGIFLKIDGGLQARWQSLLHSASIRSNSLSKMCSRIPSCASTILAIVEWWPPARARPSLQRLSSTNLQ